MNTIQKIFQDHADSYLACYGERMPANHRKAISAITECRTGQRGYHVFGCENCGTHSFANSSCGSRNCPVCQNEKAAEWVQRQQERLLPCSYFLATFTVPEELRRVIRSNQRAAYTALFKCASESLKTLEADRRFVGCNIAGFFGVLHTWGNKLQHHPHLHFVIPGGGLSKDRSEWISADGDFLVHVRALSKMFRGRMEKAFKKAGLYKDTSRSVWSRDWNVHCEHVGDGRHVMKYLGRYVFRVAVSESRIDSYDGEYVTIRYRKGKSGRMRRMKLNVFEFMRRYLQHVLPVGFMKVRHYGFLSHNFSISIQKIREMICVLYEILRDRFKETEKPEKIKPKRCPVCGKQMQWVAFIPRNGSCNRISSG